MAPQAVVRHRLNLIIRLINSVTGQGIGDRRCTISFSEDIAYKPIAKGEGVYLFLNIEKTDFEMDIHVYGYESRKIKVLFEELNENMPIKEVYLLPKSLPGIDENYLTLRGKIPGIKEIEAISLTNNVCFFKEYDKRQIILKVFNQHNLRLDQVYYGIVDVNNLEYDCIEVKDDISTQEVRLKEPLEKDYTINQPIVRRIFGQINEMDDEYILVLPFGNSAIYLVRYLVDETVHFKKIDCNNLDEQSL